MQHIPKAYIDPRDGMLYSSNGMVAMTLKEDTAAKSRKFDDAVTICDRGSLGKYMQPSSHGSLEDDIFLAFQKNLFPAGKTVILKDLQFTSAEKFVELMPENAMLSDCSWRMLIETEVAEDLQANPVQNNFAIHPNGVHINVNDLPGNGYRLTSPPIPGTVTKQYFLDCYADAICNQAVRLTQNDLPAAISHYKVAARYGSGTAMCQLGQHYHQQQDHAQASTWHQCAADKGVTRSMYVVGRLCHEAGDYVKAVKYYEGATDIGEAAVARGDLYSTGTNTGNHDVRRDVGKAFKSYVLAAELQNTAGMCKVADCYRHGTGTPQDTKQAMCWYQRAADRGDALGMFEVGYCHQHGIGTTADLKEAMYWYQRAADKGDINSMLALSDCLMTGGNGVKRNQPRAFEWCKKAAQTQPLSGKAQLELGHKYVNGSGVQKSVPEAVKCYKEAAKLGIAEATTELDKLLAEAKQSANDTSLITLIDIEAERIGKITDIAEQKRAIVEIGNKCFQILTAPREAKEDGKSNKKVETLKEQARLLNAQLAGMSAKNYSVIYAAIILASIASIEELSAFGFLQNTAKLQAHFANSQETLQNLRLWDRNDNLSILSDAYKGRVTAMTRQLLATVGFQ